MLRGLSRRLPVWAAGIGAASSSSASSLTAEAPGGLDENCPMAANQHKLPRLPLPSLDDSIARYLRSAEAIIDSPEQLAATRALASEQLEAGSVLRSLQSQLEALDASGAQVSYVSKAWEDMYLEGRWPLPINSNPATLSRTKGIFDAETTSQVARAARMVRGCVDFAIEVEAGRIAPDVVRGVPLDMRWYPRVFGATRVPKAGRDELRKAPPNSSRHIVVLRGGSFWELPVLDGAGAPLSVEAIEVGLQRVVDQTPPSAPGAPPSLAMLTTGARDTWAALRSELEAEAVNAASLATVDAALFHLCLDEVDLGTKGGGQLAEGPQAEAALRLALCGEPLRAPRWFDKSFTMMVSADGVPMWNFEHSWGDGIVMVRVGAETWKRVKAKSYTNAPSESPPPPPRLLQWRVPASVTASASRLAREHVAATEGLDVSIFFFGEYGTPQLKAWKVSPDGAVQAALALAHYKLTGRMGATYEACSTGQFAGGRTETIRPSSSAAAAWVRSAVDGAPLAEQARLLRASTAHHAVLAREAAFGQGFDRHLYVLKQLAAEAGGGALPPIFTDPTYTRLSGNELSTSTLTIWSTYQAIFGPVHPQGYGLMYHFPGPEVHFCATSFKPRAAARFTEELKAAMRHVGRVLEASSGEGAEAATPRSAL